MKTDLTRQAEKCVWYHTNKQGVFGCFEVTIGWFGKERVDFMTYSTDNTIRCYEIKVTLSDLKSKASQTFIGDYNYLVITQDLWEIIQKDDSLGWKYYHQGILVFRETGIGIKSVKKAKKTKCNSWNKVNCFRKHGQIIKSRSWKVLQSYSFLGSKLTTIIREEIMNKKVKIVIIKDVYWDDWGTMRKVFRKGWICWVDAYYKNGKLELVSGESPIYTGISDKIWDDCYKVIEEDGE